MYASAMRWRGPRRSFQRKEAGPGALKARSASSRVTFGRKLRMKSSRMNSLALLAEVDPQADDCRQQRQRKSHVDRVFGACLSGEVRRRNIGRVDLVAYCCEREARQFFAVRGG